MPIFDFSPFGSFEIRRAPRAIHDDKYGLTALRKTDEQPPPYSNKEVSETIYASSQDLLSGFCGSPWAQKSDDPTEQLRHHLIELLALSLRTNFDLIKTAIYDTPHSGTSSKLCHEVRVELYSHAMSIQQIRQQCESHQIISISSDNEELPYMIIVEPGYSINTLRNKQTKQVLV
jgi:hypothetical protein